MKITSEFRKWLPLALITLATVAAGVLGGMYINTHQPPPLVDPLQGFAE